MAGRCSILDSQFGNFQLTSFIAMPFLCTYCDDEEIEVYDLPFYWRYWANSMVVAD